MRPEQIKLVRGTAFVLLSVDQQVAETFYAYLFAHAPETRRLFLADLSVQKQKLASMLVSLVGALDRPDLFGSILQRIGRDHARLGVLPRHYELAGAALLSALAVALGPNFTPELRDAWGTLYEVIRERMQVDRLCL